MTRGPYAKGVAKRQEIIEVAMTVVAELGYQNVSMREIARRAGVSQTGLIHYFSNKEVLFVEVLRYRDELGELSELDSDILGHLVVNFAHAMDARGLMHLFVVLSANAVDEAHPAHAFFVERYERLWTRLNAGLLRLQRDGGLAVDLDCGSVARLLIAAMDGLQAQWLVNPAIDPGALFGYLWELLLRAPAPSSTGSSADQHSIAT